MSAESESAMPDAGAIKSSDLGILGLSHLVIEVTDSEASADFYGDVLGLERHSDSSWSACDGAVSLGVSRGPCLVLAPASTVPDLRDTGVHHAFAVSPAERDRAAAALASLEVEIHSYVEDSPGESRDGFYFHDPDGNRIQLVAATNLEDGAPPGLHHTAIQVADILWAERFYTDVLGLEPVHRVGWATADYARAKAWADGKEDMAPGTRRLDKRYSSMANNRVVPRVNMQIYFACGDNVLGVYLANRHLQESPEDACLGTPRIALKLGAGDLGRVQKTLEEENWPFEGPISHRPGLPVAASIYLRDPGGNFIELAVANEDGG